VTALVNWRRKFLEATLISWGKIPHPRASTAQLENSCITTLIEISGGTIYDPEVPDKMLSVLIPALLTRGVKPNEIARLAVNMNMLSGPGMGTPGGTIQETAATVENESLINNIVDIGDQLIHLNIPGAFGEAGDLISDLFADPFNWFGPD
jgi:thymidine phosphorylase